MKSKVNIFAVCELTVSLAVKKFNLAPSNSKVTAPLNWVVPKFLYTNQYDVSKPGLGSKNIG